MRSSVMTKSREGPSSRLSLGFVLLTSQVMFYWALLSGLLTAFLPSPNSSIPSELSHFTPSIIAHDVMLKSTVSHVTNIHFGDEDPMVTDNPICWIWWTWTLECSAACSFCQPGFSWCLLWSHQPHSFYQLACSHYQCHTWMLLFIMVSRP